MGRHTNELTNRLREEAIDYKLLEKAKEYAIEYMQNIDDLPVFPKDEAIKALDAFREELSNNGTNPYEIIEVLHKKGSPGTTAQTGGRYFGFVDGGIVPASLAAKWLADVWDQNAGAYAMSPVVSVLEEVCEGWMVEILGLPKDTAAGFVGGSATATLCGIAAGRNYLLEKQGYDAGKLGLFGAPEIKVMIGEGAHSTIHKALSVSGLGSERVIKIPVDDQGRIRADSVPQLDDRTLLLLQAGNVNSGSYDEFEEICKKANEAGAWVHIDGAFGLWAAASENLKHLTKGIELADSWSVDAHKTLNAPYDSGIILCRHREVLLKALQMSGSYIANTGHRDGMSYTLDMSRRARVVELWATLKSLGKGGVADLIDDLHEKAVYFGDKLKENGFDVLNDVCFNQVMTALDDSDKTDELLRGIQNSGECWCGGSKWEGRSVIRISVCSYKTTYEDIDRSVEAFVKARESLQ